MADKKSRLRSVIFSKYAKIVGAVLVVAAAGWLAYGYFTQDTSQQPEDERTEVEVALDEADQAAASGETDKAVAAYDEGIQKTQNEDEQAALTLMKGYTLLDSEDYQGALRVATDADERWKRVDTAVLLGDIYAAQGKKDAAKKQYQTAIDRLDPDQYDYETAKQLYESKINEL